LQKKYNLLDEDVLADTSKSESKEMKAIKIDPQNPSVMEGKQKIDVVALDGTNEVV